MKKISLVIDLQTQSYRCSYTNIRCLKNFCQQLFAFIILLRLFFHSHSNTLYTTFLFSHSDFWIIYCASFWTPYRPLHSFSSAHARLLLRNDTDNASTTKKKKKKKIKKSTACSQSQYIMVCVIPRKTPLLKRLYPFFSHKLTNNGVKLCYGDRIYACIKKKITTAHVSQSFSLILMKKF